MYEELEHYKRSLQTYIESTYHISSPELVALRRALLEDFGAIAQEPHIEATPRYVSSERRRFKDLSLPAAVGELLDALGRERVIFDPPYSHQADALEHALGDAKKNLVITTGTGSGKTESFLLPILGRLAQEASASPGTFEQRAIRALLLYPMNALVNDQLGRLRLLFGGEEVSGWFTDEGGRPAKFGRYTGRTFYPGVRTKARNQARLKGLKFYLDLEKSALEGDQDAVDLIRELIERGTWPGKVEPDAFGMRAWYGSGKWQESNGDFRRAIERARDPELLLRHEMLDSPPDILVTNYSMLEYMLLRPIERRLFETTRAFYQANPSERLILVLDEAHLYRGAQGTEVAMLISRLRQRLGLRSDQFQVICTSASFADPNAAKRFAADLATKPPESFEVLLGDKQRRSPDGPGSEEECDALSRVSLSDLHADDFGARVEAISSLCDAWPARVSRAATRYEVSARGARVVVEGILPSGDVHQEEVTLRGGVGETEAALLTLTTIRVDEQAQATARPVGAQEPEVRCVGGEVTIVEGRDPFARLLYHLLSPSPAVGRLVNLASGAGAAGLEGVSLGAQSITALTARLFPDVARAEVKKAAAVNALVELASMARESPQDLPLLSARVHAFFRGLPGLWACLNPRCSEIKEEHRGGPTGALYSQPRRYCGCGARVFELHTCRACGSAFAHAFALTTDAPDYLWSEDAGEVDGDDIRVTPLTLALQDVQDATAVEEHIMVLKTGRLTREPSTDTSMLRWVRTPKNTNDNERPGAFSKCPCCGGEGHYISGHRTSGDEPFQAIATAQLLEQPPRQGSTTPLRGRKSLIFSDGRQAASRLAGNLKTYSLRDSLRPLFLHGYALLQDRFDERLSLRYAYACVLAGCVDKEVRLGTVGARDFQAHLEMMSDLLLTQDAEQSDFISIAEDLICECPEDVLKGLYAIIGDKFTGVMPLALAAPRVSLNPVARKHFEKLSLPAALANTPDAAEKLLDLWLQAAIYKGALWLPMTPLGWIESKDHGPKIRRVASLDADLKAPTGGGSWARAHFGKGGDWRGFIERHIGKEGSAGKYLVNSGCIWLDLGAAFTRCERCTGVQPASALTKACLQCRAPSTAPLDPMTDEVYRSRKGYYRLPYERMLHDDVSPHPFIAEEHTAALGSANEDEAFSRAEWYELRFQDLQIAGPNGEPGGPVDILSCTTTMEVGIDIGSLTAVALRNVPPGRANYQQRAGRAGRRGAALSTVITYAGADSHDQRFFSDPEGMISGDVKDPTLNMGNLEIVRRHLFALILSL
ncbi:MAG: DEAD/DEAH box helicase, partial [Myxococcota bacterium]|nr:DEAD/DEAH box helicase [Myxococcota bacterium]